MKKVIVLCVLLFLLQNCLAVQLKPFAPWGTITVNGELAANGTAVEAFIEGAMVAEMDGGSINGYYAFIIPGDDLETAEKEGGAAGDLIEVFVAGQKADSLLEWIEAGTGRHDLTVTISEEIPGPGPDPGSGNPVIGGFGGFSGGGTRKGTLEDDLTEEAEDGFEEVDGIVGEDIGEDSVVGEGSTGKNGVEEGNDGAADDLIDKDIKEGQPVNKIIEVAEDDSFNESEKVSGADAGAVQESVPFLSSLVLLAAQNKQPLILLGFVGLFLLLFLSFGFAKPLNKD